jgi:hypothetical protein
MTWVRRRSLFAPLVQPPLLLAVAVPAIALLGDGAGTGDASQTLLVVGAPLVNSFPTMAVTTAVVLTLGVVRLVVQREKQGPDDDERPARKVTGRRSGAVQRRTTAVKSP